MPPESGISPILQNAWMKLADLRGDDDVAGERDVGARAGGDAVDRADDGQRQAAQRQHQRPIVALDRLAQVDRRIARRDGAIGQVLARAESASRTGQQQHARAAFAADPGERVAQLARASPR